MTIPEDLRIDAARDVEQNANKNNRIPQVTRNSNLYRDPEVQMVFNYNTGSPFHTSTGEPVGLPDSVPTGPNRIVGPRTFSIDFSGTSFPDAQKHTHNIIPSFMGLWKPGTGQNEKPQDYVVGGNLDYPAIMAKAEQAALVSYLRMPQDVKDGEVTRISIDQEFLSFTSYLYGWVYATQGRSYATDTGGMEPALYDLYMKAHMWAYINRLAQLAPNATFDFYALPKQNYFSASSWSTPRGQGPGSEIPDTEVENLISGFIKNPHITRLLIQNYINVDTSTFGNNKWKTLFPTYTAANLSSNLSKYYINYPDIWTKVAPAAMFFLDFWAWDDYQDSMTVFGECMAATYEAGINHLYLSGGTWGRDGEDPSILTKLTAAGKTLDQFWEDLGSQIETHLLKRCVFQGGIPSPNRNLIT